MASSKPVENKKLSYWIKKQLYAIRAGFYELGQEYVGWPLYYSFGTYELTTKGFDMDLTSVKALIRQYEQEKKIILSKTICNKKRLISGTMYCLFARQFITCFYKIKRGFGVLNSKLLFWWALWGSNPGPPGYEPGALTN